MSVNYETFSFSTQDESPNTPPPRSSRSKSSSSTSKSKSSSSTSPKAKHQLVALIFSQIGPLPASSWRPISAPIILMLEEELGLKRTLSIPTRFLDAETPSSPQITTTTSSEITPSDSPNPARILELTLTFPRAKTLPSLPDCSALTLSPALRSLAAHHSVTITLQPSSLYTLHHTSPGLAVFDMDSTLIRQEVIDELARCVGKYDQVSAITEAAMRGEAPYTDFEASLRARVALLDGVPDTIWQRLRDEVIQFTPGARELVRVLKKLGWKTAVLSGGFTPLAEWVARELGLDYFYANHLVSVDGVMTGQLVPDKPIIHAEKKRALLLQIAEQEDVDIESTIAVGDGSNDLLMMHASGMGVAFNAKPKVQEQAPIRLNAEGLLDVMYLLGYTKDEITEVLRDEMVYDGGQYVLRKPPMAAI